MPRVHRCRAHGCHEMVEWPSDYCTKHASLEQDRTIDRSHYNRVTRNRTESKREQYAFYKSKTWRHLRVLALTRDSYLCQYCLGKGIVTPAKTVDHIVPIEYDRSLEKDLTNLATTCRDCHRRKTAWEQSYYGTGQKNQLKHVAEVKSIRMLCKLI